MVMGCGRLFEGTPEQMWASLSRMAALPDATLVYSGHEYASANTRFALSVDGENVALKTGRGGRGDAGEGRADGAGAAGAGTADEPVSPGRDLILSPGWGWGICRMPKFSPRSGAARMVSEQARRSAWLCELLHCNFFALSLKDGILPLNAGG